MPDAANPRPYTPIACGFHDRLEAWAIRREEVTVVWQRGDDVRTTVARIDDVYADAHADWIRLATGDTIRADDVVSVNGISLPKAC